MIEGADEGKGQVLVGLMVVLLAGPTWGSDSGDHSGTTSTSLSPGSWGSVLPRTPPSTAPMTTSTVTVSTFQKVRLLRGERKSQRVVMRKGPTTAPPADGSPKAILNRVNANCSARIW
ncbi:hypothetical protein LTS17_008107 [Exophiala oligosperma]